MALQQQKVPVQFRGLETKLDPRQAVIGDVVLLENVRFDAPPKWQKRYGYQRKALAPSAVQLSTFRDELLVGTGERLLSYSPNGGLVDKGALANVSVESKPIRGTAFGLGLPNSAVHSTGVAFHTWTESAVGGGRSRRYSVADVSTGQVIAEGSFPSETPFRMLVVGDYLVAVGYSAPTATSTGTVTYWTVNATAPAAPAGPFTVASADALVPDGGLSGLDACVIGTTVFVVYTSTTHTVNPALTFRSFTVGGSPSGASCYTEVEPTVLTVFPGAAGTTLWAAYATATAVRVLRVATGLGASLADTLLATVSGVANVTGAASTGFANFFYEVSAADLWNHRIEYSAITDAGTPALVGTLVSRSLGLASKALLVADEAFFFTAHDSPLQKTYFYSKVGGLGGLGTFTHEVQARISSGVGGGLTGLLPEVSSGYVGGGRVGIPTRRADRVGVLGGDLFNQNGLRFTEVVSGGRPFAQEMDGGTLFTGGFCSFYDGAAVAEHGFHLYPENVQVTATSSAPEAGPSFTAAVGSGTGGHLGKGDYFFRISAVFADGSESFASDEQSATVPPTFIEGSVAFTCADVALAVEYRVYRGRETGVYDNYWRSVGATAPASDNGGHTLYTVPVGRPILGEVVEATFQVCATYEWVDASGVAHQSAPSPAVEVLSLRDTSVFDYVVPTLRVTSKATPVAVVIWRTSANQSVFYRVTSPPSFDYLGAGFYPIYSSKTVDTVSYSGDSLSEAALEGNQQLVFNPLNSLAEVAPLPLDSPKFLSRYRNRVVGISSEDPGQVLFSKASNPAVPIEFNPQQFFQAVQGGGPNLVGAVEMDDKLILFSEDRLFWMAGDGPAPNGTGNDYGSPFRIPSDVGCVNARSIVLTPQGLYFQSLKGLYLLGRDLSVQYAGAPVEAFGTIPITSANTLPDSQRVVFTLVSGQALVYDSFVQKWSVWTNYEAADALSYGERLTHIRPTGALNQEAVGVFTDEGDAGLDPIYIKFTTTWLSFAGLSGFQRVWRFILRGDYKSPHTLLVQIAFDDDPTIVQSISFDAGAAFDALSFAPYELQVKLLKQKCASLQVTITETEPAGEAGEGYGEAFALSGLSFLAGLLPGLHKVSAGRTIS